jgi:hypothetical protein
VKTCLVIEELQGRDAAACGGGEYEVSVALPGYSGDRDVGGEDVVRSGNVE